MCDLMMRQGPEGRPPDVSPARKGWVSMEDDPSAVGAALCRSATATWFRHRRISYLSGLQGPPS